MAHDIFVCLEHKVTFHSASVAGRHASAPHKGGSGPYWVLLERGIFVDIGECRERSYWGGCQKRRVLPSTDEELKRAKEVKKKGEVR